MDIAGGEKKDTKKNPKPDKRKEQLKEGIECLRQQ